MSVFRDSGPTGKQRKPARTQRQKDAREVVAQLKAFGRGRKLPEGVIVRDLITEGRRD